MHDKNPCFSVPLQPIHYSENEASSSPGQIKNSLLFLIHSLALIYATAFQKEIELYSYEHFQ